MRGDELFNLKIIKVLTVLTRVLSSEMDPAEIRFIRKAFMYVPVVDKRPLTALCAPLVICFQITNSRTK
jgi:hypothetical protein